KGGILDEKTDGASGKTEKSLKRHSVLISALTWKRLVAASAKKKSAKKITNPVDQLNTENLKKSHLGHLQCHLRSSQTQNASQNGKQLLSRSIISPRRVIVQASTGELLRCLSEFMCRRCYKLKELSPNEIILWFRNVDRSLLIQGWQDQGFITPANLVFVYLLCREAVTEDISSEYELQATFLTCLYLAYSYMGNEISYPLKPFLVETNKEVFWERSLRIIDKMSAKMLQINSDPHFFTEVFQDLKNEGGSSDTNG
ncbi:hypothetical protein M9458_013383, partial [Cirrhinus mrigala]